MTTALRTNHIQDEYERPVPGASIYVYNADDSLAALTSNGTTPIANPLTSDAFGNYSYYALVGFYREDVWFGGKLRWSENNVSVGGIVPLAAVSVQASPDGVGLKTTVSSLTIATGIDRIKTTGADALDHGSASYVAGTAPTARSGVTTANSRNFVLSKEQIITPQMFYQATDPDYQNAMEGARDYLSTFTYNNGSAFYNGAPTLMNPAGNYTMHERVDFSHTGIVCGEGDGWFGPGSGGATHFKWTAGAGGFGVQAANTSGITTVDGGVHNGSGGLNLRDMCLEGYFAGTESETHALVLRNAVKATDLYLKSWPGEGVHAWAGNVIGHGSVSGNLSTSRLVGIKTEGCRGGLDLRGADANVITTTNCEGYQNRWFSLLDDNGAGSNTHMGCHAASGGQVSGAWAQTQCSYLGNRYAAVWGGDPTVAPSGTTADTANWFYIEAGGVIASLIPAWVNTPNTFRAGGDYLTLNSASAHLLNCYSENGSFNQFSDSTLIDGGTIGDQYYRGGVRTICGSVNGYLINQSPNATLTLRHRSTQGAVVIQDETGVAHSSILFGKTTGNYYKAREVNGHNFQTAPYGGSTTLISTIDPNGLRVVSGSLGYGTGVGAAVTQLTNKSTATPAINKVCGQVTMNNAALAGGAKVSFVVTNSAVAATDTIIVSIASGGTANAYRAAVTAISAGVGFTVTVENITAGSLSEAPVVNFTIIKSVAA